MGPKIAGRKEKLAAKAAQLEALKKEKEEREERERQELERQRQLEIARKERKEREIIEMKEKQVRDRVLNKTCKEFYQRSLINVEEKQKKRAEKEWERYIKCERLPLLNDIPNLNTYLHLWHQTDETGRMKHVFEKNESMLDILDILEDYIHETLNADERRINNYKEVREKYRQEIRHKLDAACFQLIRLIHKSFHKINYWESEFNRSSTNIKLWMWAWQMRTITSVSSALPAKVFPSISIKLPESVAKQRLILRIVYTTYDHYSDNSPSWQEPENPFQHNLYQENITWHNQKIEIIKENYEEYLNKEEIPYWYDFEKEVNEYKETDKRKLTEDNKVIIPPIAAVTQVVQGMIGKYTDTDTTESETNQAEETENWNDYHSSLSSTLTDSDSESLYTPSRLSRRNRFRNEILLQGRIPASESESEKDEEVQEMKKNINRKVTYWKMDNEEKYDIDENLVLDITLTQNTSSGNEQIKSLKELLMDVKPHRRLDTLPISKAIKTNLYKMLRRSSEKVKKKMFSELHEVQKPYRSLNSMVQDLKNGEMIKYKDYLSVRLSENEINLRKFIVIGGIYHIDLLHQVPQPYKHKDGTIIQLQYGEYCLRKENFYFRYVPPVVTETDEDDEEERKPPIDDDIEKLISVEIQLPDSVLWFETPIPVIWNSQNQSWTTQDVYDIKFNEEKQLLSFRVGKTSPIGISTNRYYNLPYQTWEIKPSDWKNSKSILFSLTASTVTVEYLIEKDMVRLNSIQNATGGALDGILGLSFPPNKLVRIMRNGGLDLYPGWDSFLYVEGNSVKNKVLEEHTYLCMAKFAGAYQYTWSRWNLPGGKERIVFQLKETKQTKDQVVNYSMMVATPERASLVNCTEVSPTFSEEPLADIGFHPDLNSLLTHILSTKTKRDVEKTPNDVMFTLYYMLFQTKILSFS